jgi:hypothetical protein
LIFYTVIIWATEQFCRLRARYMISIVI